MWPYQLRSHSNADLAFTQRADRKVYRIIHIEESAEERSRAPVIDGISKGYMPALRSVAHSGVSVAFARYYLSDVTCHGSTSWGNKRRPGSQDKSCGSDYSPNLVVVVTSKSTNRMKDYVCLMRPSLTLAREGLGVVSGRWDCAVA